MKRRDDAELGERELVTSATWIIVREESRKISERSVKRGGSERTARWRAFLLTVGSRSARMETRTNSITPLDSILLGSSARGEGSASGKHPINKGRFYTRPSLLERKTARVGARARARVHAREGVPRVRLKIRGEGARRRERRVKQDGGDEEETWKRTDGFGSIPTDCAPRIATRV